LPERIKRRMRARRKHAQNLCLLFTQKSPITWAVLNVVVTEAGHESIRNKAVTKPCTQAIRTRARNEFVISSDDDAGWSCHFGRVFP